MQLIKVDLAAGILGYYPYPDTGTLLACDWSILGILGPDWLSPGEAHLAKIGSQESNSLMTCAWMRCEASIIYCVVNNKFYLFKTRRSVLGFEKDENLVLETD